MNDNLVVPGIQISELMLTHQKLKCQKHLEGS